MALHYNHLGPTRVKLEVIEGRVNSHSNLLDYLLPKFLKLQIFRQPNPLTKWFVGNL